MERQRSGPGAARALLGCALLLGCLLASAARAAEPGAAVDASPLLPATHWAVRAAQRLDDLGLLTQPYLAAQNGVPRAVVRAALEQGALLAAEQGSPWAGLAGDDLSRFDEEFRAHPLARGSAWGLSHGSVAVAGAADSSRYGLAVPGSAELQRLFPTSHAAPLSVLGSVQGQLSRHLAVALSPAADGEGVHLPEWEAVLGLSPLSLSLGRTAVGYGAQGERSLVMGGPQRLLRLELATSRPFRLPGFLRSMGWISLESFISELREARHPGSPLLWGTSVRVQPHPRLELALQRGVMVGGELNGTGSRASRIFSMLLATQNQSENNIISLSGRWRLPTERVLPLVGYAEWGADDLGAQFKAPGILAGLRAPVLPALPGVALGAEFAFMGAVCCRTFQWYAHIPQTGGWVVQDAPLGHPLGGDGREYRLYGSAALLQSRLRLDADLYLRQRFAVNLYSPYRQGTALGLTGSAAWRVQSRYELGVQVAAEGARSWRVGDLQGRATLFF